VIGVIADPAEQDVVREFFELFKTPWEFHDKDRQCEVLLCAGDLPLDTTAKLILLYAGKRTQFDDVQGVRVARQRTKSCVLSYQGNDIPIYGDTAAFEADGSGLLIDESTHECVAYLVHANEKMVVRIGYDLFDEIRKLLTTGQPLTNAKVPALELHIVLLRNLITGCGVSLVEIPPVPQGYRFIACLTHDVDHPSIRQHKWDHTMFGFLYRAIAGSSKDFIRRRISIRNLLVNWAAALRLPFVHLHLAKDFWCDFDDRYLELEKGLRSTFFVIPFSDCPGKGPTGPAPSYRAAAYGAKDIADTISKLVARGCEVGLHGIDGWVDSSRGRKELEEIRRLTGESEIGVRMHWLYFDEHSPAALEKAGAAYDSTSGYNEDVGYRAGTTQVFKPVQASQLLELPLHVMDTALFYPAYLDLSQAEAMKLIRQMADNAVRLGGCLTINWHDRSTAPERCWDECYRGLLRDLKARGAWFATAREAVDWFRQRRSVVFEVDPQERGAVRTKVTAPGDGNIPGLRFRHNPARQPNGFGTDRSEAFVDGPIHEHADTRVV
jgi:peptidoglycan/xylan/chitin deacetylase (PgdA/CDA1 family)